MRSVNDTIADMIRRVEILQVSASAPDALYITGSDTMVALLDSIHRSLTSLPTDPLTRKQTIAWATVLTSQLMAMYSKRPEITGACL